MKLETFFDKFDLLADTPDAVAKVRALVLQMAVRGKLVEQNPHDGDAASLLEAMALAKKENGRRKTTDPADAVELPEAERWHDVPGSWRWVRLGTVGDIVGGGTPRSENSDYFAEEGIPWLTPADLNGFKDKRILRGRRCITQVGLENSSAQLLPEGSVLFSSRAPIGYVAISGAELAIPPADLRKSILTLAVQGKLVPQDPNDEPAEALLARIRGTEEKLVKDRTIKRAAVEPNPDKEVSEPLPRGWLWTRLEESKILLNLDHPDFNSKREQLCNEIADDVQAYQELPEGTAARAIIRARLERRLAPHAPFSSAARYYLRLHRHLDWVESLLAAV